MRLILDQIVLGLLFSWNCVGWSGVQVLSGARFSIVSRHPSVIPKGAAHLSGVNTTTLVVSRRSAICGLMSPPASLQRRGRLNRKELSNRNLGSKEKEWITALRGSQRWAWSKQSRDFTVDTKEDLQPKDKITCMAPAQMSKTIPQIPTSQHAVHMNKNTQHRPSKPVQCPIPLSSQVSKTIANRSCASNNPRMGGTCQNQVL